jgi:hypothetical protein
MTIETDRETQKLIEDHLPLVRHVVFQVAVNFPRHVDREELATAGALGLVEAARRYDESRGVPFDRFAAQRIRGGDPRCGACRRLGPPLGPQPGPPARVDRAAPGQQPRPHAVGG